MKVWTPRLLLAALALGGATLCSAQTIPAGVAPSDGARGATHDCSGMTGGTTQP